MWRLISDMSSSSFLEMVKSRENKKLKSSLPSLLLPKKVEGGCNFYLSPMVENMDCEKEEVENAIKKC